MSVRKMLRVEAAEGDRILATEVATWEPSEWWMEHRHEHCSHPPIHHRDDGLFLICEACGLIIGQTRTMTRPEYVDFVARFNE